MTRASIQLKMKETLGTPPTRRLLALTAVFVSIVVLTTTKSGVAAVSAAPPCAGLHVSQGGDLAAIVEANPPATTFCIDPGIHRLTTYVVVKRGDRLIGADGAVISGAKLLTGFVRSGSFWVAGGQTQDWSYSGLDCQSGFPVCREADDVYFDNRPLRRVISLSNLGTGRFFFDHQADKIYIGDDPTGHGVEAAVIPVALKAVGLGGALISHLTIEKFAGNAVLGSDWVIEDNEIRLNHLVGVWVGDDAVIRHNYIHDNGELGILSADTASSNNVITDNEVARNNYAGYSQGTQAGGMKFLFNKHLTIGGNYVHDNAGPGIWLDTDNHDILVEDNRVEDNAREGILVEASSDAVVRNNQVRRNGFQGQPVWTLGSGILNANSMRVEVYGNTVEDNFNGIGATERSGRGIGPYGVRETRDFYVHDNTIRMPTGYSGLVVTNGDQSYYTSKGNRFWHNTYVAGCQKPFIWNAPTTQSGFDAFSFTDWKTFGNDTDGNVQSSCPGTSPQASAPSSAAASAPALINPPPASGALGTSTPLPALSAPALANGGFELGLAGWAGMGGTEALSVGTSAPHSGSSYARVVTSGRGSEGIRIPGSAPSRVPVAAGARYTVSVWLRGGGKVRLHVVEYDKGGNGLGAGTITAPTTLTSSWQQLTLPVTTSATTASLTVWIETSWPQAIAYDVDDVTLG